VRLICLLVILCLSCSVLAEDSLVVQGQNAAYCFDTKILENCDSCNYGASTTLGITNTAGTQERSLVWFWNWDTIAILHPTAVVDSATLQLYAETDTNMSIGAFEMLRPTGISQSNTREGTGPGTDPYEGIVWDAWYHTPTYAADSAYAKPGADSTDDAGTQHRGPSYWTGELHSHTQAHTNWDGKAADVGTSNNVRDSTITENGILKVTNFTAGVLTGATIDSVQVFYEGFSRAAAGSITMQLTKDGTNGVGTAYAKVIAEGTGDGSYEDAADPLWGTTLTAAEVNATTFGVIITNLDDMGTELLCDYIYIVIWYSRQDADRKATAMSSNDVDSSAASSATNCWYSWKIDGTLLAAWIAGTKEPWGVILLQTGAETGGATTFTSSEGATTANRPKWVIYYHLPSTGGAARRRLLMDGG